MSRSLLIINADGYGFTEGITRAIDECIDFGTVRSVSANVNFEHSDRIRRLVAKHPTVSVGCHLNPVVGRPLLPADRVPSLVDSSGHFHYREFARRFRGGQIRMEELKAELLAQIDRTRQLAGAAFSHVDFHMGLHRLPRLYPLFLEVALASGTGRIRTHRYLAGRESAHPGIQHVLHLFRRPDRPPKYAWNLLLRWRARRRGLAMPDYWLSISNMGQPNTITLENYLRMLTNLPRGVGEFVTHPAYLDAELRRYSTYIEPRELERGILLDARFRTALRDGSIALSGYRDIPAPASVPQHPARLAQ